MHTGKSRQKSSGIRLYYKPYELRLTHEFTLASGSRKSTPAVLVELKYEEMTGYGEASLPPYLGKSTQEVMNFLNRVNLDNFKDPSRLDEILDYIDNMDSGNFPAKAALDIALHDLAGKINGTPCYKTWKLNPSDSPDTSFTIGIDNPEKIKEKISEAHEFKILKVKLDNLNGKTIIKAIRETTDKPLCVDINQGWHDKHMALEMIHWLKEQNVILVEQPMPAKALEMTAWLKQHSPLPLIADEAIQTIDDLQNINGVYDGINVKLMKCGGMRAAYNLIIAANKLNMDVMMGCMTETSCGISAAAQLSPMAKWCDLDGNLLISNDIFQGVKIVNGKPILTNDHGIGVKPV